MTAYFSSLTAAALLVSTLAFAAEPPAVPNTKVPSEPPAMQPAARVHEDAGTVKMAKVMFIEPKDGATVSQNFTAKFGLEGMKIAKAGTLTPGAGHHHLIIDGAAVPKGQTVAADATHLHFGKGQTETKLSLKPGPHTLTLQFADGAHQSYGETMSQTIHITVK
jgi:hypothetical protein